MKTMSILLLLSLSLNTFADQHCQPSQWGASDEIGAANRINTVSVLKAASLIKKGKTHGLGIIIDSTTPAFAPRGLSLIVVQPNQQEGNRPFFDMTYNDDWAADAGRADAVVLLLENGADVNADTHGNTTALHAVAQGGSTAGSRDPAAYQQTARLLINAGIDVNRRTSYDDATALDDAVRKGNTHVEAVLRRTHT